MHESTTPETVTMKRNDLCDTSHHITYTHTYTHTHAHTQTLTHSLTHTRLLGLTFVSVFKAMLATLYAGTKCAKKQIYTSNMRSPDAETCSLNNWSDCSLVLLEIPHLLLKADDESTRVFVEREGGGGRGGAIVTCDH
ncbi:hypothetical protein PAMP_022182 [Pampus punctatissimus]